MSPSKRRSLSDWIVLALGTGLFVGMIPPRTATIATLLGIPLTLVLARLCGPSLAGWSIYSGILVALWLAGVPICGRSAALLGRADPREVTYDEYTTLPLVYLLVERPDWHVLVAGFALHRFFDILKPLGIRRLERVGGGLGIMLDDILASCYALAVMRVLFALNILG